MLLTLLFYLRVKGMTYKHTHSTLSPLTLTHSHSHTHTHTYIHTLQHFADTIFCIVLACLSKHWTRVSLLPVSVDMEEVTCVANRSETL